MMKQPKLFFLLLLCYAIIGHAQVFDTTRLPPAPFLKYTCTKPYPVIDEDFIRLVRKDTVGATRLNASLGTDQTADDAALVTLFNTAKAANKKVAIIPPGTYYVTNKTDISLSGNLTVLAYGATFRMKPQTRYTWLNFNYPTNSNTGTLIWLGGTIDGDQFNQIWPTNPHGGIYSPRPCDSCQAQNFVEEHGRFLGCNWGGYVLFKDVTLLNLVMDGIAGESCKVATFDNIIARGAAAYHYNDEGEPGTGVSEQGSILKGRVTNDNEHYYFMNCDLEGGSIAIQMSFPDPHDGTSNMPHNTASMFVNVRAWNDVQDAIHIEDCYKNYFYNCLIGCDTSSKVLYRQRMWISNRTGNCTFEHCRFVNSMVNMVQTVSMRMALFKDCSFTSQYKTTPANGRLSNFITGTLRQKITVYNCTLKGRVAGTFVEADYIKKCRFDGYSNAISGATTVDSCSFAYRHRGYLFRYRRQRLS
jgi:hypothetical protein